MAMTGGCLCGAVRYRVDPAPESFAACHCAMCRRWSGGVLLAFAPPPGAVTFESDETLSVFASSEWAERGFCRTCGSNIFYRVTAPGPAHGETHLMLGTLDDAGGLRFEEEVFVDAKPDSYAFAGTRKTLTEAEIMALYAPPAPQD